MSRAHVSQDRGCRVERRGELEVRLPVPTTRYFDQLLRLRCREDLLANRVFPDAKELTESFAAADAVLHKANLDPADTDITAVVVGDGTTPRTAATLALRTPWRVVSVDPALRLDVVQKWPRRIDRLEVVPVAVQTLEVGLSGRCVVVVVHAHVGLDESIRSVERCSGDVVAAVAIPCCGWLHEAPGLTVVADYEDWGIWSPERRVITWSRSATKLAQIEGGMSSV